ncbi:hypothetical protein [Rheinheimera sp.]|uniref:hypothetical protein n=1 Tax=Rheinheimera sp. TaxID=1869214 RepID=UPI0027B896CA|nr:hypothetical protein [Rheinheimera sp.]
MIVSDRALTIERYLKNIRNIAHIVAPCVFIIISLVILLGAGRLHVSIPDVGALQNGEGNIIWADYDKNAVMFKVAKGECAYLIDSTVARIDVVGQKIIDAIGNKAIFRYSKSKNASTKHINDFKCFYRVYEISSANVNLLRLQDAQTHQGLIDSYYDYFGWAFLVIGIVLMLRVKSKIKQTK